MQTIQLRTFSATAAKATLVAAVFSLVLPTAWLSLLLAPCALFWLLSGHYLEKWHRVRNNPAALAALALFLLYGIGTLYSFASWEDALAGWGKYHKLLYIPIIVSLLDDDIWRRRAADAFLWGMLLVLALSYLKWLGWIPHTDIGQGYFVFKGRIAHNIFMAFTVYLLLERALRDRPRRWLWAGIALLAMINILFLVNGRSGQVILPFILLLFIYRSLGWRIALGSTTLGAMLLATVLFLPGLGERLEESRLLQIRQEIQSHVFGGAEQTSSGLRLEFYRNALALIGERPLLGWGTGSFRNAYRQQAENNGYFQTNVPNPHNEYLLTAQQLGLVGLAALLLLGGLLWRAARKIDPVDAGALQALVLTIGIGSLFNSLLLDAGEGKFFCLLAGVYLGDWRATRA